MNIFNKKRPARLVEVKSPELENCDVSGFVALSSYLKSNPGEVEQYYNSLVITFPKYDHDPRENFTIDEVRTFVQRLDAELPHFLFFLTNRMLPHLNQTGFWLGCLIPTTSWQLVEGQIVLPLDAEETAQYLAPRVAASLYYAQEVGVDPVEAFKEIQKTVPTPAHAPLARLLSG